MSDTIITVEGHYEYHHPAERGTVQLSAAFQGPDREAVVSRATSLQSRLTGAAQGMFDGQSGPVTWWSSDRLRVWSERPWNQDGKQLPLVHHASVGVQVKFSDFGRLAAWVEEIAGEDGVTVHGIDWALTEVTRRDLTIESRRRAVADAVEKANGYAASLGLGAVRPLALSDPGMLGDHSSPASPGYAAPMARARAAVSNDAVVDLKPEDITIDARVHARFAAA
jgi:uncharacterized protein YggE